MILFYIFNNASRAANYGIGTYVRQVAAGLQAYDDIKVCLVDLYANTKEFVIETDSQGVCSYKIPLTMRSVEDEDYCRVAFYLLARHMCFSSDDQVVFQFNYFQHRSLASLLKSRYPESRIVLTVHYMNWAFDLNGNTERLRRLISTESDLDDESAMSVIDTFKSDRMFMQLADEVIVLSKYAESLLHDVYGITKEKIHTIYNCICGECVAHEYPHSGFKDLLYVGRLEESKGLKYLLKAFETIASCHDDTRLLIAGDGDFQEYMTMSRRMLGRVIFLGRVSREELDDVYRSSCIGVVPSLNEQFGYTALEMMRYGLPFVATDAMGLAERLDALPQLRVHAGGDDFSEQEFVGQIIERVNYLLSDETTYMEVSEILHNSYHETYGFAAMTARLVDMIKNSFAKSGQAVSVDYLRYIDKRMIELINEAPDIDTDFFGMSGIGSYLWWRRLSLLSKHNSEDLIALIEEHLIYFLDWLNDNVLPVGLPDEMIATLVSMRATRFYPLVVCAILEKHGEVRMCEMPSAEVIIQNALKICNCRI